MLYYIDICFHSNHVQQYLAQLHPRLSIVISISMIISSVEASANNQKTVPQTNPPRAAHPAAAGPVGEHNIPPAAAQRNPYASPMPISPAFTFLLSLF
jgi:hypothetical protein